MAEPTAVTEPERGSGSSFTGHRRGSQSAVPPPDLVDVGGWATRGTRTREPSGNRNLWTEDFSNAEHIAAFERALAYNDTLPTEYGDGTPLSPRSPPIPFLGADEPAGTGTGAPSHASTRSGRRGSHISGMTVHGDRRGEKVEKLAATSDFAPIHQRVSRRKTASASQQGWTYHLIRWPLLWFIFFIISLEFGAYVATRQIVNVFEYVLAYRSRRGRLRGELRKAKTYDEWKATAKRMDAELEFDEWKEVEDDGYYDSPLVKRVKRTLTRLRGAKDTRGLMDALSVCLRTNFAGTESVKMYSETFFGTKRLVEAYVAEVVLSMDAIRTATDVTLEEKRSFFRGVNKNYGSSALCLSGGASFGYYHFGVIRAFLDADLLPRVITGTSAGGLVAALLCTRTNDELKELLVPELADKITACEDGFRVWFKRWRDTGARFSSVEWARKAFFFTRGSLTFKEAYERTGRALNVSVVPSDRHSPTILLNHLTAPNCIIWSAIIASAAVPGILNPVVLMAKDRNGHVRPHNLGGSRFKDGSLREDIPLGSLHTQFNCNFSIVSQTNPHIHLFFFAPRGAVGRPVAHRKGKGWRGGFILSALESYIKLDLSKHFKVIRDLDLLPQILQSDWSGVFLQRFSGDLTLTPRSTLSDWLHLLDDPDRAQLARMLDVGQRVTWPSLHMVSNRMHIERAIFRGRAEVRYAVHRQRQSAGQGNGNGMGLTGIDTPSGSNRHNGNASGVGEMMSQVPIESDADAGFASRTRKVRAARAEAHARHVQGYGYGNGHGHGPDGGRRSMPPIGASGASQSAASVPEMLLRRRKGSKRPTNVPEGLPSSSRSDIGALRSADVPLISIDTGAGSGAEGEATPRPQSQHLTRGSSDPHVPHESADPPPRYGIGNLGQTFRHYRTSSLSAFPTFPFRRSTASPGTVQDEPDAIEESESTSDTEQEGEQGQDNDRTPRPSTLSLGAHAPAAARRSGHTGASSPSRQQPNVKAATSPQLQADTVASRRSQRSFTSWFRSNDHYSSSGSEDDYLGPGMDMSLDPGAESEEEIRYSRGPTPLEREMPDEDEK